MSEKKKRRIVSATDGTEVTNATKAQVVKQAAPTGNATGLRIGAAALWVGAIAFEVLAILIYTVVINWTFMSSLAQLIIALVLDLACVIAGSLLWKKANRIDPASKKNKVKFWLWNNMGLIVTAFAFIPFVIIALSDKKADKKTKTIAIIVAIVAALIGGLCSYDWDPLSAEEKAAAEAAIQGNVYWSTFGRVYHTDPDCHSLNRSDELTQGTVEQAMEANRTRLCSNCAKRDGIDGVRTDDVDVSDYEVVPKEEAAVTVYWAADGDTYHFDADCTTLADVEELLAGTTEDAAAKEITAACTVCAPAGNE